MLNATSGGYCNRLVLLPTLANGKARHAMTSTFNTPTAGMHSRPASRLLSALRISRFHTVTERLPVFWYFIVTVFPDSTDQKMAGSKIQGIVACGWLIGAALATYNTTTGYSQMVSYVKRRPDFTRHEFWDYWQMQHAPKVVPLARYFNITSYQR